MIRNLIVLNGIYDIICALAILNLFQVSVPIYPHLAMINSGVRTPISDRFFAYWIFTYGIIRLYTNYTMIALSYYIEAAFIASEVIHGTIAADTGFAVILVCLLMAQLAHYVSS